MKRFGVLGGTFDPIHEGHLALARRAHSLLGLDRVYFVPAYRAPLKKKSSASSLDRCRMVGLAIRQMKYARLCFYEIRKKRVCYTVDTLRYFLKRYGKGTELYFLAGSDVLKDLRRWRKIDEVFKISRFIVSERPGSFRKPFPEGVGFMPMKPKDVSATRLREDLEKKRSVKGRVPGEVLKYIRSRGLYAKSRT